MMTAKDETGRSWSYLASQESFEKVRVRQRQNLIVPVVGCELVTLSRSP